MQTFIYDVLLGLSGDVHFDDDEIYTVENDSDRSKRKLLWVSVHELGHSIGLQHSSLKGAVMYPWYQHFEGNDFDLTEDDILGLQQMYGMYFASILRLSVDKSALIRDLIRAVEPVLLKYLRQFSLISGKYLDSLNSN